MPQYETIEVTREGHLTWLALNRPDALNALSTRLVDELRELQQDSLEMREVLRLRQDLLLRTERSQIALQLVAAQPGGFVELRLAA